MTVRIKEWMIPYTWWDGIEITDNHVINVLLRAANNLIHVNEDRELYVDLQLPAGIAPDDDFPVGVTTGEILAEDWWQQSGTIINSKTTSWDYVRLIYANDWNLYYDPGTWVWIMIGTATALDTNTKTFFLTWTTWETNLATAQAAIDWYRAGKNPLFIYNNKCYSLTFFEDHSPEWSIYVFASPMNENGNVTNYITISVLEDWTIYGIYTDSSTNYSGKTQTFYIRPWDTANARSDANAVLAWYASWNSNSTTRNNIPSPRIITTDALWSWPHIYELVNASSSQLIFVSQVLTDEAPNDFYVSQVTLNYSGSTVTSIARNDYKVNKTYTAGSWISIDSNNVISANIQWALVYKWNVADVASLPSTWNTVWDVYYVEADGLMYAWDGSAWKAVGNTQIDLSNYFNVTTNTTDDITQGSTNLFVTQAMIDAWNWKQWALTAGTNIQINNWVISATDTTYSAGTGIWITWTTINNTAPFSPENAGTVGQVLKRTSTGVRWWNEMSIQGTTFWSLMTACANNWREHVTYFSNESNVNTEWTENYTFQWLGWIRIKSFHWASWQASMRINGVTVLIEQTWSWPYTVKLWLWPFTMWPWDAVTFYTEQWGSAATLEAYVFDYY